MIKTDTVQTAGVENIRYDFGFYVQLVASYRCIIGKAALPREFKDHFVLVTIL